MPNNNLNKAPVPPSYVRIMCLVSGVALLGSSVILSEYVVGILDPTPPLQEERVQALRVSQIILTVSGLFFMLAAEILRRSAVLTAAMAKPLVTNIALSVFVALVPIFLLEAGLRPFSKLDLRTTTIFEKDGDLGWRLKPNAKDLWCGEEVTINGKGLRGPELPYQRSESAIRILYLGDSVTFGCTLSSYEETFPYLVERNLEAKYDLDIETLNAGVGGYSPWQEYLFLKTEGIKYDPDLIVVSFVLNDVTEKFGLVRFGGSGEGSQLNKSAHSFLERIYKSNSGILYFVRRFVERRRFGLDVQAGAKVEEDYSVRYLLENPNKAHIAKAWKVTLANLEKIVALSREREVPIAIVLFPYSFQMEEPALRDSPHLILAEFAADQKVSYLHLRPRLDEVLRGRRWSPGAIFSDSSHPSKYGSAATARILSEFLVSKGLILE